MNVTAMDDLAASGQDIARQVLARWDTSVAAAQALGVPGTFVNLSRFTDREILLAMDSGATMARLVQRLGYGRCDRACLLERLRSRTRECDHSAAQDAIAHRAWRLLAA
jgi:hypothetical protein